MRLQEIHFKLVCNQAWCCYVLWPLKAPIWYQFDIDLHYASRAAGWYPPVFSYSLLTHFTCNLFSCIMIASFDVDRVCERHCLISAGLQVVLNYILLHIALFISCRLTSGAQLRTQGNEWCLLHIALFISCRLTSGAQLHTRGNEWCLLHIALFISCRLTSGAQLHTRGNEWCLLHIALFISCRLTSGAQLHTPPHSSVHLLQAYKWCSTTYSST